VLLAVRNVNGQDAERGRLHAVDDVLAVERPHRGVRDHGRLVSNAQLRHLAAELLEPGADKDVIAPGAELHLNNMHI
jgi:hypothetical protein